MQLVSMACAVVACGCAVYVAWRAGHWRNADRVLADAKHLNATVADHGRRLLLVEAKLEDLPTSKDVEAIRSDVRAIKREIDKVDAGVTRIEGYLMAGGRP